MRLVILFILSVLIVDALVLSVLVHWAFLFLVPFFITAFYFLVKKKPFTETDLTVWSLGRCTEITNPDKPTIENAFISMKTLLQGVLCFGQPGSGKSESFSLGLIDYTKNHIGKGIAFFDGKGDLDIVKKYLTLVTDNDFFFSTELEKTHSINLMEGEFSDVLDRLSIILIGETSSTSFYSDQQYVALSRVLPLLLSLDTPVNLRDLYVVFINDDAARDLLRRAKTCGVSDDDYHLAKDWLGIEAYERKQSISGLLNKLFEFVAGERSERLNAYQPDISIESVINKNQCVYFHCPATRFSKSVAIAIIEMFAVQARHRQLSGGSEHEYYALLFDDWGKFVHDGFGTFMARARSANMPAAFSFQSIAQIKEVSHVFTEQMDDLAATKIFLRVQGESTIDYALRLFGQHEITDVSASRSSNHDSSNVSARYESRLEARQLKELDTGQCYITTQQSQGMKTRNPYWLAQFPLPDVTGWKDVELPDIQKNTSNEGLNFWAKYFNPSSDININELKRMHDEVLEAEAETNKRVLANSGWGA